MRATSRRCCARAAATSPPSAATPIPACGRRWRQLIAETSSIPIYDHSLEDVSKAFADAGFSVAVRPLGLDAFMQVSIGSAYFPKVTDQLRYYTSDKVLF